ncbi:polyamine aminopropyltransferase [Acetomicrobium sp. UBA5826]|uniref:polyamine aminopropyltransferase n=1 Tax=Acetomicrobium sp. UBA5826 TaxID=1946039 RepID=UPI0025799269|nr:polyamine aminopropyltransferase [Acetomicrobium sp. UBA5826]
MGAMERRVADLWFTEYQTPNLRLGLRIRDVLLNKQSPYQHILVVDTDQYGKVLVLDGAIQLTENDEFCYHEMMAHLVLCAHPCPERVLVIGGGDGGVVREAIKHESVKKVTLVDIDEDVINTSRTFFPNVSCALEDDRVEIKPMDALLYVKERFNEFDIVIIDSTDPVDFASGLFEPEFYKDVHKALKDEGLMIAQTESPFAEPKLLSEAVKGLRSVFENVYLAWGAVPTYPTGFWTYSVGSKSIDPRIQRRSAPKGTKYYSDDMHSSAFKLPPFVWEIIDGDSLKEAKAD